eukprot:s185_g36.t2
MPAILMPKPGSEQVQVDIKFREEELQKQIEKAGEPGSVFWSPAIMKSHITDMLNQLHTSEMEELLGEQIELLRAVCTKNSGLAKWLSGHDQDSKDHHEDVKSMVEGLEQRVEKCGRKSETTLYGCQDMGERMVALINAAFAERERVRQLLLSDADIVVTEEKKALLEERRRIGQEMSNKVRLMKQQEDEFGYGGIAEPPAIADLRRRIEKKTKKQNKLKAEQEGVQHRLKSLEQALQAVERGDRTDKIHALDQNALETIEEAKGLARQAAIAPLLERMKREQGLESPEPIEMPESMVAEKEYLEQALAEVEKEIEGIENLRVDWEGQRQAARKTVQYIDDEAEKRLSLFSAKRRRSYLGPMQVEPPLLMPMPPFLVEKAPNIKAGLRRRCREMQEEMEPLMKLLPKYLELVKNAEKTAKELCEQREEFVRHIRSLKPKFLKDLRSGGARKMGNQDINAKLEEEQMMKEVENAWDAEEARLLEGHEALHHRAGFFSVIAAELEEEFNKLEESVQRNRWAFQDKMALEALHEQEEGEEERGDEDFELNLPEDEAEPAYVENFLAMEEPPPPSWDGSDPGLQLPSFEKNVKLWGYESELEAAKRGVRLLRNLTGVARSVADTLEFEQVANELGVANIMAALRTHFAPHMEVSLPRAFERAVYGQPRGGKESMQEYLIRQERNFHLLEKEGLKMDETAVGYIVYRQASLTESQELKFSAWSEGRFDLKTVQKNLRKLEKVIPEHKDRAKGSSTFVMDDEQFDEENETDFLEEHNDQWVYIEESDDHQLWEEAEVQVALATYQEVRKAIQTQQKNRQYYKSNVRGPSGFKHFLKGKKKISIEELKLRTKCGRCGLVGHWAKECRNEPDSRGRQHVPAASGRASTASAPSSTSGSSTAQQSWYVSSGSLCSLFFNLVRCFGFQCRGYDTEMSSKTGAMFSHAALYDHEEPHELVDMRGTSFCFVAAGHFDDKPAVESCAEPEPCSPLFFGLTTAPCLGVVDTAAQDGLIGSRALTRLKEQLSLCGLQVKWTGKQAKAHGVGGQAKVLGIVAIPLGIAGSSGILEATVVEGEIPLLLPIKMLRQLHAVIDLEQSCLHFPRMARSISLSTLPSGHIAIDILQFEDGGFKCPVEAARDGYSCVATSKIPLAQRTSHSVLWYQFHTPRVFQLSAMEHLASLRRRFQSQASGDARMGVRSPRAVFNSKRAVKNWRIVADKLGVVQDFLLLEESVSSWSPEITEKPYVDYSRASSDQLADIIKHATQLPPLKSKTKPTMEAEWCPHLKEKLTAGANQHAAWITCTECHSRWAAPQTIKNANKSKASKGKGKTPETPSMSTAANSMEVEALKQELQQKDRLLQKATADLTSCQTHGQTMLSQMERKIKEQSRSLEILELMKSEYAMLYMGREKYQQEKGYQEGEMFEYAERWLGRLEEMRQLEQLEELQATVAKLRQSAHYEVAEVYAVVGDKGYVLTSDAMLEFEDVCAVKVVPTVKERFEDALPDIAETALSKTMKKKLRKAHKDVHGSEGFPVAISEVFSPPRISTCAKDKGLKVGACYDLQTGFDLLKPAEKQRMWDGLTEDDPELVTCSPPCTPFTPIQELNWDRMPFARAVHMVAEGVENFETAVEVCVWQDERDKVFLLEHPLPSRAWAEECVQELIQRPGIYVCQTDMCQYGMKVRKLPNKKATRWVTNSKHVAMELQRRCNGEHEHEHLMGGLAKFAAVYPKALCQAVVRGLMNHLRAAGKLESCSLPQKEQFVWLGEDADLDVDEDVDSEAEDDIEEQLDQAVEKAGEPLHSSAQARQMEVEKPSKQAVQLEVEIGKDEQLKIHRLHVNLGHPSLPSFLRFLRAGRVRPEVLRWVRRHFSCETCQASALPKAPRPSLVPKSYAPGVAVGLDLFFIPDLLNQKSIPILNIVDLGTNYQVIEFLRNKDPKQIWFQFWRSWARTFGLPQFVAIDEGREFRAGFAELCANAGTVVVRTAARAPWQNGRVERHGGLIKAMIEKSREEMPPEDLRDLAQILYACECAKNRFSNRSGYSPTQRQIGQWPRMPSSLMSDEALDPALQVQGSSDDFQKLMEMRRIAQEAFVKVASQDAAAKALKARPRGHYTFKAGDVVYVYRALWRKKSVRGHLPQRGAGIGRRATWIGPGHVLAMEGSIVWINMFGELWRAAVEQVRGATNMERLGAEMINEACEEMQERLKRSSHRAGYRDITGEPLPEMEDAVEAEDEVAVEGELRGMPRARLVPTDGANIPAEAAETTYSPSVAGEELPVAEAEQGGPPVPEGSIDGPSSIGAAPTELEPELECLPDPLQEETMMRSVERNESLDGVPPPSYDALRHQVRATWRRREEAPYFNEIEVFFEAEEVPEAIEEPTKDYWVFDSLRNVLQRHHVVWRKALFNPMQAAEKMPVPLRSLRKKRKTHRIAAEGEDVVSDEWSLFSKKEERKTWWKGITEFEVDPHFLEQAKPEANGPKKKRGEGEVFPHEISPEDWPAWQKEDQEEFDKIVKSGALRVLSLEESREVTSRLKAEGRANRILPSRMVRRHKPGDQPGDPRKFKSRFCIRGDRDPDAMYLNRFAPTVTTSNLQVLIQAAVNRGYKGKVGDLKSAFTQSMPLVRENGPIYCRSCHGSMPGLHPEQIAEVVLGCYGLVDAPLNWRRTLTTYLTEELQYRQSSLDPCTYLLHVDGALHGMIAVEVDDLLMFGDEVHEERMQRLQKRFTFGKMEEINEKGVSFNGRRLRQCGGEVRIDMKAFIEERLQPVKLNPERAKLKQEDITEEERSMVRSTCGALNWAGREGRPDAASSASMFSSLISQMKISDVLELNKVVSQLQADSDLSLRIQPMVEADMRWGVFSDASWANARNGKTQAGHMLVTFEKGMLEGEAATMNLLHWKSGKLQRTVNSTLAAETQSLARGVGDLLWMMVMYLEIVNPEFQLRDWRRFVSQQGYTAFTKHDETEALTQAVAIVDAKSLYDLLVHETTGGSDRRNALDVQVLREELGELYGKIRWIEHLSMPADCLTKKGGRSEALRELLRVGKFGITEESKTLQNRLDEDESSFLEKAIAAYRIHDEQVLARFIEEGLEVEKQAVEERKKEMEDKQVKRDIYISLLRERRNSMAQAMVSPQDSMAEDSGSNPMSRTASKDTLAEEESPSARGSSLLRSASDGHRNKLSLPSGSPKPSRRVQTMPRLISQGSRPGSAQRGEASSRPSSASSRDSSPGPSEAGDVSKTTSELGTSATLRGSLSSRRGSRELGRANTSVDSRGSKSTERKKSKGKGGKKRLERNISAVSKSADKSHAHEPDDQGDETTPSNRPEAPEDTGASESDVDPQAQGSEHLQQFLKLDRKSSRLEAKVREATEQLSQMRSEVQGARLNASDSPD